MANRIQIRRDSENNWYSINPVLADGELALTYDNNKIKIGNGNNSWSDLSYIVPSLATVATSGDYNDLSGKPTVPSTLQDLISYSAGNNKQFLRFNSGTSAIEFANDFRVVPYDDVEYPGGTLGSDVAGDIAFDDSGIYYCYQTPNSYSVNYSGSTGWVPAGWIKLDSRGPGNGPQVGDKLTDGTYTSTVASIEANWTGTLMLINISPAISSWKNGSGSLTVYTGTEPHLKCWARLSTEIVTAPSTLTSNGVAGQMAYDSNYIYRCIQTNVTEVSSVYRTPKFTNAGYTNQGSSTDIRINNPGSVAVPQIGWIVSDGSSTRTVTNVNPTSGQSGNIWILTLDSGIDWSAVTSLTLISQPAVTGQWVRASWFSGSYNDLDDKPTIHPAEPSFSVQTTNFNASVGTRYGVNTTLGTITATLPASPATGDAIYFVDAGGAYSSNNLTVARNGHTIMGSASDMTVSVDNQSFGLFYNGTTWRVY